MSHENTHPSTDGYGIKRGQVPELIEREFDFALSLSVSVSLNGSRVAMEVIIKWKVHLPFRNPRNLTSQTDGKKWIKQSAMCLLFRKWGDKTKKRRKTGSPTCKQSTFFSIGCYWLLVYKNQQRRPPFSFLVKSLTVPGGGGAVVS